MNISDKARSRKHTAYCPISSDSKALLYLNCGD